MYRRRTNLTNARGRANYVKNKSDIEEVVGYCDTASAGFWSLLAKENREQFRRSSNAEKENARAIEGRELVLGLPPYAANQATAEWLAQQFKETFGVECVVGIHKKRTRDAKTGELSWNIHAHLIHAERHLLDEPIQVEERRAERTYYYDANGKKCPKAKAVKVTPKGSITQEGHIRYFTDKLDFYDFEKSYAPFWRTYAERFNFEWFDDERHFAQKKIGKNNPKGHFIRAYNELVTEMNSFFDVLDSEGSARPAKKIFCEEFSVPARFTAYQTDEIRAKFEAFRREKEVSEEELRAELERYEALEQEISEDIEKAETVLTAPGDFVQEKVAAIYQTNLQSKYHCHVDRGFLAYLKELLTEIKAVISAIKEKLGIRPLQPPTGAHERRQTQEMDK